MDEKRRNGLYQALRDNQRKARIGVQTGAGAALLRAKSAGTQRAEKTEHVKGERSCHSQCLWLGDRADVSHHVDKDCDREWIACPKCSSEVVRCLLDDHFFLERRGTAGTFRCSNFGEICIASGRVYVAGREFSTREAN